MRIRNLRRRIPNGKLSAEDFWEEAGTRPVLVISAEEANQSLPVVSILPITNLRPGRKVYPIEVLLPVKETGLSKDSIAMAHQIFAISKHRLREKCGSIESEEIKESIRNAVKLNLDLE